VYLGSSLRSWLCLPVAQSWSAVQEWNGRVANASWVYSSMMLKNRTWRPSAVRSFESPNVHI